MEEPVSKAATTGMEEQASEAATTRMEGPGRVQTLDLKKLEQGMRLAEWNHKNR